MGSFLDLFKRKHESSAIFDWDLDSSEIETNYLKKIAIQTVVDFVARTVASAEFKVYKDGKLDDKGDIYYKLNVRPNPNQSASMFWRKFIHKLIEENEVVVIKTDKDEFYVVDSFNFTTANSEFFPKTVTNIQVGDFSMKKNYSMDDVFYLQYSNEKLAAFISSMNNDISSLYSRMVATAKRNNQIRSVVDVDATMAGKTQDEARKNLNDFIDKAYKAISEKDVAIIPQTKGFDYKEISNSQGVGKESISDLRLLQNQLTDTVADLIGVPIALLHGDHDDLSNATKLYVDFCANTFFKEIEDETTAKIFTQKEFAKGSCIKAVGVNKRNIFDSAEAIDKLISSSAFTPNQILEELGREPREGGDEYILTKNYSKGGENE